MHFLYVSLCVCLCAVNMQMLVVPPSPLHALPPLGTLHSAVMSCHSTIKPPSHIQVIKVSPVSQAKKCGSTVAQPLTDHAPHRPPLHIDTVLILTPLHVVHIKQMEREREGIEEESGRDRGSSLLSCSPASRFMTLISCICFCDSATCNTVAGGAEAG